jgi:TolB protein
MLRASWNDPLTRALTLCTVMVAACLLTAAVQAADPAPAPVTAPLPVGIFDGSVDIGTISPPGKTEYDADKKEYRLTGAGDNMWFAADSCQFAYKKVSGDLSLTLENSWVKPTGNEHRKVGWMVRQTLAPDSAHINVSVHGNGLIGLLYRPATGAETREILTSLKPPATVKFDRDGDLFTVWVKPKDGEFQPIGSITMQMPDPVYAGVFVCSHDAAVTETAVLTNVTLKNTEPQPGQRRVRETYLETMTIDNSSTQSNMTNGIRKVIYTERATFEAPNWSPDGKYLLINKGGRLYTIPPTGGSLTQLDTGTVTGCNNDHGLSFDGKLLAISDQARGQPSRIYVLPSTGGTPRLVTQQGPSYWHGWSPDGKTLAFCGQRNNNYDIYTISVDGGEEKRLTTADGVDDGPEYSPDGKFIYFNSERTGTMKIWRMNADGTDQRQLTTDGRYNDWFAHPSPDGKYLMVMSYDKSVSGHPESKDVLLHLYPLTADGIGRAKVMANLFGGQGTINMPSWSPDSKSIALVSYRFVLP